MIRVIDFSNDNSKFFRDFYEGFCVGAISVNEDNPREKRTWDSHQCHDARISRKIKKITREVEKQFFGSGDQLRELIDEKESILELTQEELTRILLYIKRVGWRATKTDEIQDLIDFLESTPKKEE